VEETLAGPTSDDPREDGVQPDVSLPPYDPCPGIVSLESRFRPSKGGSVAAQAPGRITEDYVT